MKTIYSFCLSVLFIFSFSNIFSQHARSDGNLFGHVLNGGEHIPFANVVIKGTTIGTATDETGHYNMVNLPEGTFTVVATAIGYRPVEKQVTIVAGQSIELNFKMEEDAIGLEEVVITGDRNEQKRRESSVVVNTVPPKVFSMTHSVVLGEGLNFTPGLRMENNCQNCGFTQLRMNGLEGPYSQILINSRPIFSGLAGVYGLELIPSNMIDRVEVIRGGGSALYGSNAIAGTVNLILKDPINNSYEIGGSTSINGVGMDGVAGTTPDNSMNFSASAVSSDVKTGLAVFGFVRNRDPFDANNDSFSELSSVKNTSVGARAFHRFGYRSKLTFDFFNIREDRRGGDRHAYPLHESGIAEAVDHNITTGALTYDQFFRESDVMSVFASAQHVNRDSYYGANQSLSDYGLTTDLTYSVGTQYKARFNGANLIFGIENQGGNLRDTKLGYPDIDNATVVDGEVVDVPHTANVLVADQMLSIVGSFAQLDYTFGNFKTTAGLRYDYYKISDNQSTNNDVSGNVLSPRVTLMYDLNHAVQARVSYAKGYRAPQIFDEDLHIETSGSRKVIHLNSPDLIQETSHSFMSSVDFNFSIGSSASSILVEGFYTQLNNPFANEYGEMDENGVVVYTRVNATSGAVVQGVNTELNFVPSSSISLKAGFTFQKSEYQEAREFNERTFFRTPNTYGFITAEWEPFKNFVLNSTGTYTGKMLVPYFGPTLPNPEDGVLRESDPFFDLGFKVSYGFRINGATLQMYVGVKNIFGSYQSDFDMGIERDPGYVYGPNQPRAIYFGIRVGNRLR
ncbi:MAG TPA: TonB-dependent receptor [Tenuifilaceae bacterium]|nr:TonB-dependent receptor [Tenuifilaceae bacterium]HRX68391.1 TonB-dependent receptor [Tenuifilaceae bacterium]